ncbi:MAG: hypothetical protein V2A66_10655 [Pseudomonadota bacterium]
MLAVLGAEIHLMPDWTVAVQLCVFFSAAAAIHFFVLRPVLRIIDQRKKLTSGAREDASLLAAESAALEAERVAAVSKALADANAERTTKLAEARIAAGKIVAEARAEAKNIAGMSRAGKPSEESIAAEVGKRSSELAREIVSRITSES